MPTSTRNVSVVAVCWLAGVLAAVGVRAQARIRVPAARNPGVGVNSAAPMPFISSSATLQQPVFDPYSTAPPNAASVPPTLPGGSITPGQPPAAFGSPNPPAVTAPPYTTQPPASWPAWTDPGAAASPYAFPNTGYPSTYPQQPSVLFPNGLGANLNQCWPMTHAQEGRYLRLFQDLRLTHTWIAGGEGTQEMGSNDTELGTTVNFPNFFWSGQPLQVSPGFIMHWWDGPETSFVEPNSFPTELPSRVYSAYLGFGWQPYLTPQLSADLDVSIGVFNDFESFTTDSVRIQGTGLGVIHLTPTLTLKAGVTYLDRVDVKLLPAGGIVWTPDPRTRWDIYFPRPKVSRYLTTLGNTDLWIYLNGEYGGGSWTIRREGADDRRVDINELRVGGGLEWTHQFGLGAFVEVGYVFDRELVFASGPPDRHSLKDTYMLRGGLVY